MENKNIDAMLNGTLFRKMRLAKSMTIEEVAFHVGVSTYCIHMIETRPGYSPRFCTAVKLMAFYNVTLKASLTSSANQQFFGLTE